MPADKIPVAIINPDAPAHSLEAKQPAIDNGSECYSKEGYFSADFMTREWDTIWTRSWLIAAVESELPELNDYLVFDIGNESILITRTDTGIKAFYNVCSHRGTRLVWDQRGNRKVFVCPFHSWSFHNNGELRRITDEETFQPEVIAHRPGLTPLACETFAGIIFVNMGANPVPPWN